MFEIVVGIFIITNTTLQLGWFWWSYKNHHRKHYTDDTVDSQEIELYDRIKEYYDTRYQNEKETKERNEAWKEFAEHSPAPEQSSNELDKDWSGPKEKEKEPQPQPQRGKDGKYDHKEIDGDFDGFFNEDQG